MDHLPTDLKKVAEVTGFGKGVYIPWRETILDTVDSLIEIEVDWKKKGFSVEVPAYFEEGQEDPDIVALCTTRK